MGANDAEESGQLIPELPEELVMSFLGYPGILALFAEPSPNHGEPCWTPGTQSSTSKPACFRSLSSATASCSALLTSKDHDIHELRRTNTYEIQPHWRKLPPLHGCIDPPPTGATMVASSGMVYVWSANVRWGRKEQNFVLKLDIGCADWTWKKFPVPYAFNSDAITFHGKIYVPRISTRSSTQEKVVLAHDMMTDNCRQVETWRQDNLRVLSKRAHSSLLVKEMYGFLEDEFSTKLEVVMYDVGTDSWRTREEMPIPEFRRSYLPLVELLSGDCFEPASEMGINIVWIDDESGLVSWFNSSAGITWVDIHFSPRWEGKYLGDIQFIQGSMYGIFLEDKEDEEDSEEVEEDGEDFSRLPRRVIMKGRIIVASSSVAWEEVHEIGFFNDCYLADRLLMQPIDCYTTMV